MSTEQPSFFDRLLGRSRGRRTRGRKRPGESGRGFVRPTPIDENFQLATLASGSEARLLEKLSTKPDFSDRLAAASAGRDEAIVRLQLGLLTEWYRADPVITPALTELADVLARTLRVAVPIDVFVRADPSLNAFCMPSRNGKRLIIGLTSAVVETLGPEARLSVMGHEAGHALLGHGKHPRIEFGHPAFSLLEVARLRALERRREIACDRVGLLASQDLEAACNGLLRLLSGMSDRWFRFDEKAFQRHFDRIQGEITLLGADTGFDTHPIIPLRLAALIAFARSEPYARATGKPGWEITSDDLERQVEGMLAALEPDFATIEGAREEEAITQLLVFGALLVIAADGVVDPDELRALSERLGGRPVDPESAKQLADPRERERVLKQLEAPASVVRLKLTALERLGLLRVMTEVADATAGVCRPEFEVLDALRGLLDLPTGAAQATFGALRTERERTVSRTAGESAGTAASPGDGAGPPRAPTSVAEVLRSIVGSATMPEEARTVTARMADAIAAEEPSAQTGVRRLVAWAVTASRPGGRLTHAQSRQVVLGAIAVVDGLKRGPDAPGAARRPPLAKRVGRHGVVALFRKGERVEHADDGTALLVEAVSKVHEELLVREETASSRGVFPIKPHYLVKSATDGRWPPELTLPAS